MASEDKCECNCEDEEVGFSIGPDCCVVIIFFIIATSAFVHISDPIILMIIIISLVAGIIAIIGIHAWYSATMYKKYGNMR